VEYIKHGKKNLNLIGGGEGEVGEETGDGIGDLKRGDY